jgi:hypothetical protein
MALVLWGQVWAEPDAGWRGKSGRGPRRCRDRSVRSIGRARFPCLRVVIHSVRSSAQLRGVESIDPKILLEKREPPPHPGSVMVGGRESQQARHNPQ